MRAHPYRITVGGNLGRVARHAFEGFGIETNGVHTYLSAHLDQAALHGALNRIRSLGFELIALTRISEQHP